ncbi:MFS general substrate transporter, partial [Aureobasidium melanogenum]
MALDEGANGGVHAEKTREDSEEQTPTGSQAQVHDHSHGTIQSTEADTPAAEERRSITGLKWFFAYGAILSTVFLFALDGTIVANLQPSIVNTFRTEQDLAWIGVSFMLGNTTILPLGQAFGVFDIKWLFIICLVLFEVGSALCGAAPDMDGLIVGRVIAGVGGCGIYAGGLNYVALLTTNRERPLYLAGIYCIWGIGCVLGPVIGGAFAQSSATWRWGFYINLPIAALFAPAYLFTLPGINPLPDKSLVQKLRVLDWIGTVVFLGGCTCFSMALNFGGTLYKWNSGSEIALLVMTAVLLIAFILVTIYHPGVPAENKLLPVGFMRSKDLISLPILGAIVAGVMFTAIYYTPLLFQFTKADGPLMGGVRILPLICLLVFFALLNAFLMPKFGYFMPWYVFGNALMVIGAALMVTIKWDTPTANVYGYTILLGAGIGCYQSAGVAVATSIAPRSEANHAVSIMTIAQVAGILAALCVTGAIFQNLVLAKVAAVLPARPLSDIVELTTGASSSLFQGLSPELKEAVISQVTDSIRNVFIYVLAVSAWGLALSVTLSRKKLY